MKVNFRKAKSIITKSNIPSIDYVINPYTGCQHACIYCYAEFMIRFTNHKGEKWGEFLDVKTFDFDKIIPQKYNKKRLLLSSVTDPYLPFEKKYLNTRKILEKLVDTEAEVSILTKSKLVTRDIDLFQQFKNIEVGISISTLDDDFAKKIERGASKPSDRIIALKEISNAGIKTYTFISPFFPEITDFKVIIKATQSFTNQYSFENLNFRPHNISRIMKIINANYPQFLPVYEELKKDRNYWDLVEMDIRNFCEKENVNYKIEFHHGGFSKS
ncbi:MAG: radical SAM protein [Candidatus Hodarchaeales archaeon]